MKEKKRDKLFKWFQNCKCKWSKYLYVLRGLAFHGPYFFLGWFGAFTDRFIGVISFGGWMFAKSPVTVVSLQEKEQIQIHSL